MGFEFGESAKGFFTCEEFCEIFGFWDVVDMSRNPWEKLVEDRCIFGSKFSSC
jgi:hypothetical protein